MRASRSKPLKLLAALAYAATRPATLRTHLGQIYDELCIRKGRIPVVDMPSLVPEANGVALTDFLPGAGNVSVLELLCLCLLVGQARPRVLLEVGTFDGNTTLQLATNAPADALVYTLDLPPGSAGGTANDRYDTELIRSESRHTPRYVGASCESRIRQVYGNSLETEFSAFLDGGRAEFVFVDAGHSYECVKNDTEKSLAVLARGGTIVWHDYTQLWPDVYNYLNELAEGLALVNIRGTSLVVHRSVAHKADTDSGVGSRPEAECRS